MERMDIIMRLTDVLLDAIKEINFLREQNVKLREALAICQEKVGDEDARADR